MCAIAQVVGEALTATSPGPASMTLPRVVALTHANIDAWLGVSEKFVEKDTDVRQQGLLETPRYSSCVTAASWRSARTTRAARSAWPTPVSTGLTKVKLAEQRRPNTHALTRRVEGRLDIQRPSCSQPTSIPFRQRLLAHDPVPLRP
jgi:hypothetical protein